MTPEAPSRRALGAELIDSGAEDVVTEEGSRDAAPEAATAAAWGVPPGALAEAPGSGSSKLRQS